MDFSIYHSNFKYNILHYIPINNPDLIKFNFKIINFDKIVTIDKLSTNYKAGFKLSKKLIYKKLNKTFFILKMKHIR